MPDINRGPRVRRAWSFGCRTRFLISTPATGGESPTSALGAPRGAAQPTTPAEQAIHHTILRAFAIHGGPPASTELDAVAAEFDTSAQQILNRLHASDVIRLDASGRIGSVYPFSATPTPHRVQIADGARVYAMCAIDALGMSAMLDADIVIDSADASTGEPITVTVHGEDATADPATTVVFVGAQSAEGPSADTCCNYLNFFTDRQTAETWARGPHRRRRRRRRPRGRNPMRSRNLRPPAQHLTEPSASSSSFRTGSIASASSSMSLAISGVVTKPKSMDPW